MEPKCLNWIKIKYAQKCCKNKIDVKSQSIYLSARSLTPSDSGLWGQPAGEKVLKLPAWESKQRFANWRWRRDPRSKSDTSSVWWKPTVWQRKIELAQAWYHPKTGEGLGLGAKEPRRSQKCGGKHYGRRSSTSNAFILPFLRREYK